MKVVINGNTFEDAGWSAYNGAGELSFQSDETIQQILEDIGEAAEVEVYNDSDVLLSVWKNNSITSIKAEIFGTDRIITVGLDVSALSDNAEAAIHSDIDESIDGIMELAELLDEMDGTITEHGESIETLEGKASGVEQDITEINLKLSSIPNDIVDRFGELWSSYNSLADRVARLENGGE